MPARISAGEGSAPCQGTQLSEAERARLNELVREGVIGDDVRRRIERDLDLGEQRSRGNRTGIGSEEAD